MESWTIFGIYTGFSWSPDNKFIYIWSNGKIIKVDVNGVNLATEVPFTCSVKEKIYDAVRYKQNINPAKFNVNVIRQGTTSPDGKWFVFNGAGYLWKKELPNGTPKRITSGSDFEFWPSFSSDGKTLVYSTWNDQLMGSIYKIDFEGTAKPAKLSSEKGIYSYPSFSPDGKSIIYYKDGGDFILGNSFNVNPGVYIMDIQSGKSRFVSDKGNEPRFNSKGDRIYYNVDNGINSTFGSYKTDGSDDRDYFQINLRHVLYGFA